MKNNSPEPSQASTQESQLRSIEQMVVDAGIAPGEFLKIFQSDLKKTPDPRRAFNNIDRFLSSGFSASLLRDFHQHRSLQQIALELFSQSQYLADILVRDPELFRWLTATSVLNATATGSEYLREARAVVAPFGRAEKKLDALKRFQRRELLRIGAREILEEAEVSVTAGELSALADAIVSVLIQLAEEQLLLDSAHSPVSTFAVIGLGKLGGSELNFSSDIDLMFVYDQDGDFDLPHLRVRTLHEYYARVAELMVRNLTEHTGEGHLYRVDLRLRPEGTVGPIALSRAAYRNYYETRGELWERQMLTKARVIAGNHDVGEQFLYDLRPFVYPKSQRESPLKKIAEMKEKIETRVDAKANIKLGSGGIRDIEFIVQALQLLNGGTDETIRVRNTLEAIERMAANGLLKQREEQHLTAGYKFFRVVEHRLQLLHGMQTHSLPDSAHEMDLLAKRLRFHSAVSLKRQLDGHRRAVRKTFDSVFVGTKSRTMTDDNALSKIELRQFGFLDKRRATEQIEAIRKVIPGLLVGMVLRQFLRSLAKWKSPDWGLRNFATLVDSPSLQRSLQHVIPNGKLLELLLLVCSRSRRMTELLANEPLLFETLVGKPDEILDARHGWRYLEKDNQQRYKSFNEFRILLRWLAGRTTILDAVGELSLLADEIVNQQFLKVVRGQIPIALVALGKYGGNEITAGSDLDLILVYRNVDNSSTSRAEEIARTFVAAFSYEGSRFYDIDMRLRPEGKSAPLAVEYSYLREYLGRRASLWERQSFIKARIIAGDEALARDVRSMMDEFVYLRTLPEDWVKQVTEMRRTIERERTGRSQNLKVGKGGLVDIEFLVQVLQLKFGAEQTSLRSANTAQAFDALRRTKLLATSKVKTLGNNLLYVRSLETLVRINSEQSEFVLPTDGPRLKALAAGLGEQSAEAMSRRIRIIRLENRRMMLETFRKCHQG